MMSRADIPALDLDLQQRWPAVDPAVARPIRIIGAGGIVNDAHLPAYRTLGLEVAGVFDLDVERARSLAAKWGIEKVYESLDEAVDVDDGGSVVFDVATPPGAHLGVLEALPNGTAALFQKPMGLDLDDATAIRDGCARKGIAGAVNFQHRFSPAMLALKDAMLRGMIGDVYDLDVRTNVSTPWHLWPFMEALERMEIALHSIHYLDSIRRLIGTPRAAMARTLRHDSAPKIASTRTSVILDYGDAIRCSVVANHHHTFGPRHEASELRIEGAKGAAILSMGVNLDYPKGRPDWLEITDEHGDWRRVELIGSWFVDAFRGPMSNLQRYVAGADDALVSSVDDAWHTMAVVEACYASDAAGGVDVPGGES